MVRHKTDSVHAKARSDGPACTFEKKIPLITYYQTYNNPASNEISITRQSMRFGYLESSYAEYFFPEHFSKRGSGDLAYLSKKLEGKVVVDLGCGINHSNIAMLAAHLGASLYIGTDIRIEANDSYSFKRTAVLITNSDMLEFASRLPTASVNFVLNGIDFFYGRYLDLLLTEIERATEKGGIVFGRGSEPIESGLKRLGSFIRKNDIFRDMWDHFVFEKD